MTTSTPAASTRHAALVLVLALLASLSVLVSVTSASASPAPATASTPRAAARADRPTLPASCYGPGQDSGRPRPCHLNHYDPKRPSVLIWGDSHAWMFIPGLEKAVQHVGHVNLVAFVDGGCPPVFVALAEHYPGKCELGNALAYQWVLERQRSGHGIQVVLGSNWQGWRAAYRHTAAGDLDPVDGLSDYVKHQSELAHEQTAPLFAHLAQRRIHVDVMRQSGYTPDSDADFTPCLTGTVPYRAYVCDLLRSRAIPEEASTDRWLKGLMRPLVGSPRYIDTTSAYCDALVCHGRTRGITTWYDQLHLSATRTRAMWRYFLPTIQGARALGRR